MSLDLTSYVRVPPLPRHPSCFHPSLTVKTQIEDTGARTLELPLLVRRLYIPFVLSQLGAEFCGVFPSRS